VGETVPAWVAFGSRVVRFFGRFKEPVFASPHENVRVHRVTVLFFLEDDTLQIIEPRERNAGIPQGCSCRATARSGATARACVTVGDLAVAAELALYGRTYLLADCDAFTRAFMARPPRARAIPARARAGAASRRRRTAAAAPRGQRCSSCGSSSRTTVACCTSSRSGYTDEELGGRPAPQAAGKSAVAIEIPPPSLVGSDEDVIRNCLSLHRKPRPKDEIKLITRMHDVLRFRARIVTRNAFDAKRMLILMVYLSDDTVQIYEPPVRNSGIIGGKYLQRVRIKNPETGEHFKAADLEVVRIVTLNK
jgi:hypothetical protein